MKTAVQGYLEVLYNQNPKAVGENSPTMSSIMSGSNKGRPEKIGAIVFALLLWHIGALLLDQQLLLVTPLAVIKRLFSLWTEADFLSTIVFSFLRIVSGFFWALSWEVFWRLSPADSTWLRLCFGHFW